MPRPKEDLEKRSIRFTRGTIERIRAFYPNITYTRVVRVIVEKHLQALEDAASTAVRADLEEIRQAAANLVEDEHGNS